MEEENEEKTQFVNKAGTGRYFSQGSSRRISVPVELDAQLGWQDKQNLKVEVRELDGKTVLVISEL